MTSLRRSIALWCPDWFSAVAIKNGLAKADTPIATVGSGRVISSNELAVRRGVLVGQRLRDAQVACPSVALVEHEAVAATKWFRPLHDALCELSPGVQLLEPGLSLLRARGPARYYGSEQAAAELLLQTLEAAGYAGARAGVSDTVFSAIQAARIRGSTAVRIIPPAEAAGFLRPLPVQVLEDAELVQRLLRLGIRTLGEFAKLPGDRVSDYFGAAGLRAHGLARADDTEQVLPTPPAVNYAVFQAFEPPLEHAEQLAFSFKETAERFVSGLFEAKLVTTRIAFRLDTTAGTRSERSWSHPEWFSATELLDRLRWQLAAPESEISAPVCGVALLPLVLERATRRSPGLWSANPQSAVHKGMSRLQGMLGRDAVRLATIVGGRLFTQRVRYASWGEPRPGETGRQQPWPGSLPAPFPASVFPKPLPAVVLSEGGQECRVDKRGELDAEPAALLLGERRLRLEAWAGPFGVFQHWWREGSAAECYRLQAVTETGEAWALLLYQSSWFVEAKYD